MLQSKKLKLVPSIRQSSPVSWIGTIATSLLLWSILIWCIRQVSVDLF
jgi:hypothetical protein